MSHVRPCMSATAGTALAVMVLSTAATDAAVIHVPADRPTIQAGIDAATDGDEVVVAPGLYAGEGNRDLDFRGKAITVRSQDPQDAACVRGTTIDAEGRGVIVRFISDEGPRSRFEGFTLVAGDTSSSARGIPGFFAFSDNARPTTMGLHIGGDGPVPGPREDDEAFTDRCRHRQVPEGLREDTEEVRSVLRDRPPGSEQTEN